MSSRKYRLLVTMLIPAIINGQTKPALPANYYDTFSYTLSDSLDYHNDSSLQKEVTRIAHFLLLHIEGAYQQYTIDSTDLYDLKYLTVVPAILAGNYTLSLQQIIDARKMRPSPAYRAPFALPHEAYNKASLQHADDHSPAFTTALRESFKEVLLQLDPSFRDDLVNAQKGNMNTASIAVNFTQVENIVTQAMKETNRSLSFFTAYDLTEAYFRYMLRKRYQPQLEALLYELSPARVLEEMVMIPMRDSVHLSAFVYRNTVSSEKVPAVVSLSPYPSGSEGLRGNVFATNGYIYVYVDSRGRRKSEGTYFPYEDDARDFYDIIDWVSKQPWCNGQVATSGGSYLGFTQWQAIRKKYRHPALKAVNPMVAVGFGVDFPRFANQFYSYILQWAVYVSGKDLNDARFADENFWNRVNYTLYKNRLPFKKLDSVAGSPNPYFQKWVSHPDFDHYWTSILPNKEDYATLDIPMLTITGYYDADQLGAMYYYNNHQRYASAKAADKHYLLIGPWDHGGSQWQPGARQNGLDIEKQAQIPIYKYVIWWYDWVLKGKQKPAFLKDKVNYFATGTGEWKSAHSLNSLPKDTLSLYLSPQTIKSTKRTVLFQLSRQKPVASKTLSYEHDIAMAIDSAIVFARSKPFSDSLYMGSAYNMVFESEPLEKDVLVNGKITAQLFLSLNVPDADYFVNMYEITPEGKSLLLANASLRSRYRNSGAKPQLMKPGQVALHNFDQEYLYVKKLKKGTRIRFTFEVNNHPASEKNYGFGGVVSEESTQSPRIIKVTLHSSPRYPSRISLPYTIE